MITNAYSIILYLMILPMGLGIIFNFVFRREKNLGKMRLATRILDDYVSGFLIFFFTFEVVGLCIINTSYKLSAFIETMTGFINVFVAVVLIATIVVLITKLIIKISRSEIVDDFKSLKPIKSDIAVVCFIVLYIAIAILFVMPSLKDDTSLNIYMMQQKGRIGTYNVINGELISSSQDNIGLIEVFYIVMANVIGISDVQSMLNIMIAPLLLVFFGVYKRIEYIFFGYNKKLSKYRRWTEILFAGICIVLLFVNGSLNVAIPQNIWNGTTILTALIMPLGFIYGYGALCEVAKRKLYRASAWLIRFLFVMPIAAMMRNDGYEIIAILDIMIVVSIIVLAIVNCVRRDNKGN